MLTLRRVVAAPMFVALLELLSACSGGASQPASGSAQDVSVQVDPADVQVAPAGTVTFAATVTGTIDTSVVWEVVETGGGAIDGGGVYTAPGTAGTFHVRATSNADAQKQATATVNVTAAAPSVSVSVSPASGSANACQTLRFTATVANATDAGVTWSVQEGTAGGTVATDGTYTAPPSAGTYHVVATSRADVTKRAVATVVVTEKVLAVAVTPTSATVQAGGSTQFTATVTTTCGAFSSIRTITAAGVVLSPTE